MVLTLALPVEPISVRPQCSSPMARWVGRQNARRRATTQVNIQLFLGIILVACLLGFYFYKHWNTEPLIAIIGKAWVIDGDTIEISGTRIRLEGIDAPESDQTCTDSKGKTWPCGTAATNELRAHIRGRELTCNRRALDRYKRVLAVCSLPDGSDINAWMVQQGWAVAYGFAKIYESEEAEAEATKRGIWAGSFVPPSQWRQLHNKWHNRQTTKSN
jgi:endonuclease YncB( thermonuclease family)